MDVQKTKDYLKCSKAIAMMTSILEYLISRYGKEYKSKIDEIRGNNRYGIGKYGIRIHGKNENQVKAINNKRYEIKNNHNKHKLDRLC